MSASHTTTGLARMRSLRNPAKSTLTAPQPASSSQIPSTTSNISLFLTNLRLLDLDQEADWPGISSATFSAKDAAGGLKNRIQSVEWALYHLFVLWDGEEARSKLKPFYPPLDQVQSINLRAALLRCLEQAKKNGVLGRDAVLRKTMLDECKGERFEEMLAVFSSAVLKRLVAERALNAGHEYRPTTSEKIALENYGYTGDRTALNGLLLAHKVSLQKIMQDKELAKKRYQDFEEFIAMRQRNIVRRREQVKQTSSLGQHNTVTDAVRKETAQAIRMYWTGNDRWAETLLRDDTGSQRDGFLSADFGEVWAGVQAGNMSHIESESAGLMERLDQKVRMQQCRVEKWEGFRQELFGNRVPKSAEHIEKANGEVRGVDLGFTTHKRLRPQPRSDARARSDAPPEYESLLRSMCAELDQVKKPRVPNFFALRSEHLMGTAQHPAISTTLADSVSDLSEWEDEPEEAEVEAKHEARTTGTIGSTRSTNSQLARNQASKRPAIHQKPGGDLASVRKDLAGAVQRQPCHASGYPQPSADHNSVAGSREGIGSRYNLRGGPSNDSLAEQKVLVTSEQKTLDLDGRRQKVLPPSVAAQPYKSTTSKQQEDKSVPPSSRSISPTQLVADEILASMSNASPSPKKLRHTLSLAERTRMSMVRTKSFDPDDDSDPNLLSPSVARSIRRTGASTPSNGDSSTVEDHDDLVARTRRSMAGFDAARQKAQLQRAQSQKKGKPPQKKESYFPQVVEEEEAGDASVMDTLMESNQADMEAVFRSRPKMRTSPAPSPNRARRGWNEEDA